VLVGVGLVSYGLLHLVIAWIALQLVFGKRGDASQQGALSQLARQPLGAGLLWVMALGLFTLTVWQRSRPRLVAIKTTEMAVCVVD
jgi:hypothetical protein